MSLAFWLAPPASDDPRIEHDGHDADHVLVARVRAGDDAAFEAIFRTYYRTLVPVANAFVHSIDVAKEVVADVFAMILERRASWTIRTSLRAYLIGATRHRASTLLRGERRALARYDQLQAEAHESVVGTPPALADAAIHRAEAVEHRLRIRVAVHDALEALPERYRRTITMRWHQQMTFDEIAEALGTTPHAARMTLSRAMQALRARLGLDGASSRGD